MNFVDLLLIIIILLSIWSGWRRGFIIGVISLGTWIGSLVLGFLFYPYIAVLFERYIPSLGVWTLPLSFILTVILARILISIITGTLLKATPVGAHRNVANKALGIIPGFVNGLINAIIIAALLLALPLFEGLSATTRDSQLANKFVRPAEWLETKLSPVFDEAIKKTMNKMTVEPGSHESAKLPYTVTKTKVRQDLEAEMLEMVNEERTKEGLQPLKADPEMTEVARAHSKDMFARGFFAHVNPDNKDPFDRMRASRVKFLTAGENLALAQTLRLAHNGLMNSPGHRANILHKDFGRLGIGIIDGGMYGLMISQEFRN
jgi:uncharacterized protein YkwD